MFELRKSFTFEAAHLLEHHDGKCARLHGHSWKLTVILRGDDLQDSGPKKGMLVDYGDISKIVKPLVESHLDHWYLNDTIGTDMPTSEFLARWVYDWISPSLPDLYAVMIDETCTSSCFYCPTP